MILFYHLAGGNKKVHTFTKSIRPKANITMESWGNAEYPTLPSLSGPLWPVVVALDRVIFTQL